MKILSSRGYNVRKSDHDDKLIESIKKELTVTPYCAMDFQTKPSSFALYMESTNKLYVPKAYGLKKFGTPDLVKLSEGDPISLTFQGALRPEQGEPVKCVIDACHSPSQRGGILNVFCGGGKTTMALYILSKIGRKTLIIVHKDFLLNQWKERIEQFLPQARVGLIKAKTIDIEHKDIVLASLQSLSMKEYEPSLFDSFGLVIIDEVHHTSAEVFSQALKKVTCMYSIGLSATIKRKDGLSKVFMWYLGDVVYKANKRKDVVKVLAKEFYDPHPCYSKECVMFGDKLNISKMINNLCSYFPRIEFMTEILKDILSKEPERKVLILSDRRNHLELIKQYYDRIGIECGLYFGGLKQDVLRESEKKQVILATFAIAAEGYDQKGLDTLILASPKSDVIQSVGRILRDKEHERKHVPMVIDIIDKFSIFEKQACKRLKYYKSCGYDVDHAKLFEDDMKFELKGKCML